MLDTARNRDLKIKHEENPGDEIAEVRRKTHVCARSRVEACLKLFVSERVNNKVHWSKSTALLNTPVHL